ncbi:MAG: molybdopterin molybdotransferase MoeA [Chloroflexi bacterium]|jgi:molybdopterin molybdotransferase|nr:molybdopterin molybdotransferase MoeA [Chloroflexota bacterium]
MYASRYPVISMEEAWEQVAAAIHRLPIVTRPLDALLGHVLAEDVTASENMPPFPASAMDGYAVVAADQAEERLVIGEQDAGLRQPFHVQPGTAVRIMTGAPLPDGADAVVPFEQATERDGHVRVPATVAAGAYVRPAGQDIAVGNLVLAAGTLLGAPEIGLLATVGRTEALVYSQPTVAVIATGDELVSPGQTPGPGQIRDSNSYALAAAVRTLGYPALRIGPVPDTEQALREAIREAAAQADMVLTSGGVSMGTRDLIKPILEELGTVHFGRVAIKPGKPLTFATLQGVPMFGLPGFPVSSLVCFEMFVRPALRLMAGYRRIWRPEQRVRLSHAVRHTPDRAEFQRAVVTQRDGEYWAETTGNQVSGRLLSLVGANALLKIPAGVDDVAAGESVIAILIDQPEAG